MLTSRIEISIYLALFAAFGFLMGAAFFSVGA